MNEDLVRAIWRNDVDKVKELLPNTTNINDFASFRSTCWDYQANVATPLAAAVEVKNIEIAKLLLKHGANPKAEILAMNSVAWACYNNDSEMLSLLLPRINLDDNFFKYLNLRLRECNKEVHVRCGWREIDILAADQGFSDPLLYRGAGPTQEIMDQLHEYQDMRENGLGLVSMIGVDVLSEVC